MQRHMTRFGMGFLLVLATVAGAVASPRMTRFDPVRDGFKFVNTFDNDVVRELDIRTGGLCGGMVYSALDYYNAGMPIPPQDYKPAVNAPLHDYLYDRQVASLRENLDKWTELGFNPLGARNAEFFRWGLQGSNGGRLQELRARIDRGTPVPLGLWHYDGKPGGDHQVLAIGYDLGRYRGDLGQYQEDLRIFVYDPNHPGTTMTLVPDTARGGYRYLEHRDKMWLTYFVDAKYRARRPTVEAEAAPASAANRVTALLVHIGTGGDDLRGGNDNVDVILTYANGRTQTWRNVNGGRRWLDRYAQDISLALERPVALEQLKSITLKTRFGGGIGGDNWNVDALHVDAVMGNTRRNILYQDGTPLVRFTGQVHEYAAMLDVPRLQVPVRLDPDQIRVPRSK